MKIVSILFCLLLLSAESYSGVSIVANINSSINSVDVKELERLYLGKNKELGGVRVIPVNQDSRGDVAADFNRLVLNKSSSQVKAYWSKIIFTGKGNPPDEMESDQKVINAVKENPELIGYINSSVATAGVKIIATFK